MELNLSQLKEVDKAYLAGLFDGEGCANATFRSKEVTLKSQKKVRYFWPTVQLVISNKNRLLLALIKGMVELGQGRKHLFRDKVSKVWSFRITQPKQVLNLVNVLLQYVKLRNDDLLTLREAALFILKHKYRSRWSREELQFFYKNHVKKLETSEKKHGRPTVHQWDFLYK